MLEGLEIDCCAAPLVGEFVDPDHCQRACDGTFDVERRAGVCMHTSRFVCCESVCVCTFFVLACSFLMLSGGRVCMAFFFFACSLVCICMSLFVWWRPSDVANELECV